MPHGPEAALVCRLFANELADRAAGIALELFRGTFEVRIKTDESPVTEADLAIEDMVRRAINDRYPNDAVLGEEGGLHEGGDRRWTRATTAGLPRATHPENRW